MPPAPTKVFYPPAATVAEPACARALSVARARVIRCTRARCGEREGGAPQTRSGVASGGGGRVGSRDSGGGGGGSSSSSAGDGALSAGTADDDAAMMPVGVTDEPSSPDQPPCGARAARFDVRAEHRVHIAPFVNAPDGYLCWQDERATAPGRGGHGEHVPAYQRGQRSGGKEDADVGRGGEGRNVVTGSCSGSMAECSPQRPRKHRSLRSTSGRLLIVAERRLSELIRAEVPGFHEQ
ncbi:unnamed protein product [Lampetra fluviatilis]